MSIKVVLDTNCVVSALLFSKQNLAWLRHAWQSGTITSIVDKTITAELIRVLNYPKFKLTHNEHDQVFMNLAVVDNADALVSSDLDLMEIRHPFPAPPIMTLSEFQA